MKKRKQPVYKKWWFWVLVIIAAFAIFSPDRDKEEDVETEAEVDEVEADEQDEDVEEEKETEEVDLNIELEISETDITEEEVIVRGTTNLIDGAFLTYQLKATESNVKVSDGTWEVVKSIKELDEDDELNFYGDGSEYNFYITFPAFGVEEEQSEEIIEVYGNGATNITGGPNFYESEDGSLKTVSVSIDFDQDGIINPEEKEKRAFEQAVEDWEDHFKADMLEHYGEAGITRIEMNPGSDWDVVNVYVPNEFKLGSEEEKTYYVEEIGPLLEADLTAHFKKDHDVHVYFFYEDGNTMASRKMFGGWKIK